MAFMVVPIDRLPLIFPEEVLLFAFVELVIPFGDEVVMGPVPP
jgi:hypothetical protein